MQTPNSQTWSQRFETALHPAIACLTPALASIFELLEYDLTGSAAHAKMLVKTGIISPAEGEQIVNGLETIRQEYRQGDFTPGVEAEDVHFAVERRLIELIGDVGKKLHTARSRNDQVGTDIRLYLRAQIEAIQTQLRQFQQHPAAHCRKPCRNPDSGLYPPAAGPAPEPGPPFAGLLSRWPSAIGSDCRMSTAG
jgi:argininosuccinate lyase